MKRHLLHPCLNSLGSHLGLLQKFPLLPTASLPFRRSLFLIGTEITVCLRIQASLSCLREKGWQFAMKFPSSHMFGKQEPFFPCKCPKGVSALDRRRQANTGTPDGMADHLV